MNIQEIFAVPIYDVKLSLDCKELEKFCNQYKDNNEGRIISNLGGYQSDDLSLDEHSIEPLIKEIEIHASNLAHTFISPKKQVLRNMWININGYKDSNTTHNHPTSDISGIYYVKTPKDCGNITFEHPAKSVLSYYDNWIGLDRFSKYNTWNSSLWTIEPSENKLYLFPSWLSHHVVPNNNKEERISISFNTSQLRQ